MRGPLHALGNSNLIGTSIRFRIGLLLAGIFALGTVAAIVAIGDGWGLLALFTLVFLLLLAVGVVLNT
jgi:hypothetical protein